MATDRSEYLANYRLRNRARRAAYNATYRAANRERRAEYQRAWQKANPDKVRASALARWARRRDAVNYVISDKDWRRLLAGPCSFPGCIGLDIEVDHVIPLTRGGSHGVGNLQSLCRHHNRTKHNKLWIEFRSYLTRASAA